MTQPQPIFAVGDRVRSTNASGLGRRLVGHVINVRGRLVLMKVTHGNGLFGRGDQVPFSASELEHVD